MNIAKISKNLPRDPEQLFFIFSTLNLHSNLIPAASPLWGFWRTLIGKSTFTNNFFTILFSKVDTHDKKTPKFQVPTKYSFWDIRYQSWEKVKNTVFLLKILLHFIPVFKRFFSDTIPRFIYSIVKIIKSAFISYQWKSWYHERKKNKKSKYGENTKI